MMLSPIVLFAYKRPHHTRRAIEALRCNELASQSRLIIYADGPKTSEDLNAVYETRCLLNKIDGFKSVNVVHRDRNWGLASSIINGVTDVVDKFGKVIVLEDDLVTSPYFLNYMNESLDLYEHDEPVISVHGYIYPLKQIPAETFFLLGADCWGWGTWKRGWECFNPDGRYLMKEIKRRKLVKAFNFNGTLDYFSMLSATARGRIDSWAVRWYASALLKDKLTLYPGRSLIRNIGTDSSGTHCRNTRQLDVELFMEPVRVWKIPIEENRLARSAFEGFFASLRQPLLIRLISKLITNRSRLLLRKTDRKGKP
jgi:hypothetical protein